MSNDRKEPTLSNPATSSEKRASTTARQPVEASADVPTLPRSQEVVVQKQSSALVWLVFLMVIATAAIAAYTFWLSQNAELVLAEHQSRLVEQQQRIEELENKLVLSGNESTQSLTALTANAQEADKNLKLALSEVNKLWDTRKAARQLISDSTENLNGRIDELEKSLQAAEASLQAQTTKTAAGVRDMQASLKATEKAIEKRQQDVAKQLESDLGLKLAKPVAALQQKFSEQELLIQSLREKVIQQKQSQSASSRQYASKKELQALSKKIDVYDETVKSFDRFRITVNRDILALKQQRAP